MMRRWGWVSFFLAMLLLCAGAWSVSYWECLIASVKGANAAGCMILHGSLYITSGRWEWGMFLIHGQADAMLVGIWAEVYRESRYHALGFAWSTDFPGVSVAIIPLWFPTLLSFLGVIWAWRRKRRSDRKTAGFEVEGRPSGKKVE